MRGRPDNRSLCISRRQPTIVEAIRLIVVGRREQRGPDQISRPCIKDNQERLVAYAWYIVSNPIPQDTYIPPIRYWC